MSTLLKFDTLRNIRDLGGARAADGRLIKTGRLIRCGHLADTSEEDRARLADLVDLVVDFRSDAEVQEQPDRPIRGASFCRLPVVDSLTAGISREEAADRDLFTAYLLKPDEAKRYMCGMYRAFVEDDRCIAQYDAFVHLLLQEHEKGILWHCTAGKDRAGIAAVLIEELLGIPGEEIRRDYLMTNTFLKEDIRHLTDYFKKEAHTESPLADEALGYLFGASGDYLKTFYEALDARFGSFGRFVREGLHLSDEDTARLRELYLEPG